MGNKLPAYACRNKFRHELEKLAFRSDLPPRPKLIFWIPAFAGMAAEGSGIFFAANLGRGNKKTMSKTGAEFYFSPCLLILKNAV